MVLKRAHRETMRAVGLEGRAGVDLVAVAATAEDLREGALDRADSAEEGVDRAACSDRPGRATNIR